MKNVFIKIHNDDNCAVATENVKSSYCENGLTVKSDIPSGHKIALCEIPRGGSVIKYGMPIGTATKDIKAGEHIHIHNLKTALSEKAVYEYNPEKNINDEQAPEQLYFSGYRRGDGRVGVRNEIWIIPTVGCVNKIAEKTAQLANEKYEGMCDGVFAFTHPYGCSQLGGDLRTTQNILAGLIKNGNAGGVLILSLGCENNNLNEFMPLLDGFDKERIRTLVCQNSEDEIEEGKALIGELAELCAKDKRTKLPFSQLTIGLKCGGSDGFSGITANPLCGRFTDRFASLGGKAVLSEVPEMFGAETLLMNRAQDETVFSKIVNMINNFKQYFVSHGQTVYENPSPGNKDGGITTLEEKSLGCVQKGGTAIISDVLLCGNTASKSGLNLLTGPGNDIVAVTNLTAAGANLILFTTGRGTPLGAPVPTIKIATNSTLAVKKKNWVDYNAGEIISGKSFDTASEELFQLVLAVADGKKNTANELNGCREIALFKDGVTL